jgi:hypothetical protein
LNTKVTGPCKEAKSCNTSPCDWEQKKNLDKLDYVVSGIRNHRWMNCRPSSLTTADIFSSTTTWASSAAVSSYFHEERADIWIGSQEKAFNGTCERGRVPGNPLHYISECHVAQLSSAQNVAKQSPPASSTCRILEPMTVRYVTIKRTQVFM